MKRLVKNILPICIISINATVLATSASAAEKHSSLVRTTPRLLVAANKSTVTVQSKSSTTSKRHNSSRAATQTKNSQSRPLLSLIKKSTAKPSNTHLHSIRAQAIDPTRSERTPVTELPEISWNSPRDPNGPVDGNDYRPPVIEEQPAPLPEGVDPGKLPGRGDPMEEARPDTEPSSRQRNGGFSRWIPGETTPDGTPLWEDEATRELWPDNPPPNDIDSDEGYAEYIKWVDKYDGGDNTITYGPSLVPGNGSIPSDDGIVTAEEMNKIAHESNTNTGEDPEPEGDDPDEIRNQMASEQRGITSAAGTGQNPLDQITPTTGQGSQRKPGEWLPGESIVEHGRRVTSATPLPEDGGPDESSGSGDISAVNKERFNLGLATMPTPDAGQGGGPINPGPNAVQGQLNISSAGMASSPAPEAGEGGGTTPPRPEM